jgi:hypothetical protein
LKGSFSANLRANTAISSTMPTKADSSPVWVKVHLPCGAWPRSIRNNARDTPTGSPQARVVIVPQGSGGKPHVRSIAKQEFQRRLRKPMHAKHADNTEMNDLCVIRCNNKAPRRTPTTCCSVCVSRTCLAYGKLRLAIKRAAHSYQPRRSSACFACIGYLNLLRKSRSSARPSWPGMSLRDSHICGMIFLCLFKEMGLSPTWVVRIVSAVS